MFQQTIIIGRIGKITPSETRVNFSIAVSEKYKDKEKTEWFNCTAWDKLADIVKEYAEVGALVFVEAKQSTSTYEKSGETKMSTNMTVNRFRILSAKSSKASQELP